MDPGDKVHYIPHSNATKEEYENGIIKEIHPDKDKAWVVYHCAGEWDKYYRYTGALTDFRYLKKGWV
jgi:hypothetical protein